MGERLKEKLAKKAAADARREHRKQQKKLPKEERLGAEWMLTDAELKAQGIPEEEWADWRALAGTPSVRQRNKLMDHTSGTLESHAPAREQESVPNVRMPRHTGRLRKL